jgi:hypothetical protein
MSRLRLLVILSISFISIVANAQDPWTMSKEERDAYFGKIREASAVDHKKMLDQLGITSIRPGANGNDPSAPNAANYDEAKANPFPVLPDPLTLNNGKKVKNEKMWWEKRRPEIVALFDKEIYGVQPPNTPKVTWEVISTTNETEGDFATIKKVLKGHVDNSSYPDIKVDIDLTLVTPANATKAVPIILELSFNFPLGFFGPLPPNESLNWKQQLLAKGWGYAQVIPTSIQADNGAGLTKGIIGLMNKGQTRKPDDWGALRAWGWGASRALDYLETNPAVDAKRVGVTGHSRYGKAAAVAMAYDSRFAVGFITSSGEGGLKLHRRNYGELVENVAASGEYHWMAGNFIRYAGPLNWNDLPVDSHELIALIAPRPVFISAGDKGDQWVDPKGSFLAGVGAGPVYKLLGQKDLGTTTYPPLETNIADGAIAFRQHTAGHTAGPNWPMFIAFASRFF